jgi:hypothetical protein
MNPTVIAAAIGVSGTVVVGVAGFGANIWNTRKTLLQARDSKLWDERAAVYVDTLAAIHYRQVERDRELTENRGKAKKDKEALDRSEAYLASFEPPDWHTLEARLLAFASSPVAEAVRRSWTAHAMAMETLRYWLEMRDQPATPGMPPDGPDQALSGSARFAFDRDGDVVNLIRRELQSHGHKPKDLEFLLRTGLLYDTSELHSPWR